MLALTVNGQVYRLTEITEFRKAVGSLHFYKVISISEISQVSPIKVLMISCCLLIDLLIDVLLIVKIKGMASVKVEDVKLINPLLSKPMHKARPSFQEPRHPL